MNQLQLAELGNIVGPAPISADEEMDMGEASVSVAANLAAVEERGELWKVSYHWQDFTLWIVQDAMLVACFPTLRIEQNMSSAEIMCIVIHVTFPFLCSTKQSP